MQQFLNGLFSYCDSYIEVRTLPDGKQEYFSLDDVDNLERYAKHQAEEKKDVYFGCSTRDGHGGAKENVLEIPSVWVDIDFKDIPEEDAINRIKDAPLMPTYIVRSGGGFHCYWKLTEPCGKDDMERVESVMRRLVYYYDGDGSGAEIARILRLPGTKNYKPKYETPTVSYKHTCKTEYELCQFEDMYPEIPKADISQVVTHIDPTVELSKIMSCEFMKYCKENASTLSEPQWFAMISQLAGKKGGPDLIHQLSRPYPGYSRSETDHKIIHTINEGGPFSCQKIKNIWDGKCSCAAKNPASRPYSLPDITLADHNVTDVTPCHALSRNVTLCHADAFEGNLTESIREYVEESTGYFSGVDVDRELGIPQNQAATRRKIMSRLYKDKVIKKDRNNKYIKTNINLEFISLSNNNDETFSIKLPLGISDLVTLPPRSIVIVAGTSNSGKTAFLLNLVKQNLSSQKELFYFMSEMGPQEYVSRVNRVCNDETEKKRWEKKVKAADLSTDFSAAVSTYATDGISVIDYLEDVDGEYFKIPAAIRNIYDSLNDGIAVVALQKHSESDFGRGGQGTTEKARLYVSLDKVTEDDDSSMVSIKIIKAKSYPGRNPNGMEKHFRIIYGSHFEELSGWIRVKDKAHRESIFEGYKHESDGDRLVRLELAG